MYYVILNLCCDWLPTEILQHSTRLHPSYGDCLEGKREYYQNCSVLDCATQCSQSAAHLYEHFLQVHQIRFVTLTLMPCYLELYYCNMVGWFWCDSSLILTTNWFNRPRNDLYCVEWDVKQAVNQTTHRKNILHCFQHWELHIFVLVYTHKYVCDFKFVELQFAMLRIYRSILKERQRRKLWALFVCQILQLLNAL